MISNIRDIGIVLVNWFSLNRKPIIQKMTLEYTLTEDDYLQHQLYIASKTDRIKNKRLKSWIIVVAAFIALTLLFFDSDNTLMMYYFGIFSVISLLFYPFYQRYHYKKHYQKFIKDTYKHAFGEPVTITFNEHNLETYDVTGESKFNYTVFEEIIETANHFFIRVKTGGASLYQNQN